MGMERVFYYFCLSLETLLVVYFLEFIPMLVFIRCLKWFTKNFGLINSSIFYVILAGLYPHPIYIGHCFCWDFLHALIFKGWSSSQAWMRLLLLISIKKLTKTMSKPFGSIPPNIKYQNICLLSQIIMLRMEWP